MATVIDFPVQVFHWSSETEEYVRGEHSKTHKSGKFLKGPVPIVWLEKASSLPGKAFIVGVILWYLAGLNRSKTFKMERSIRRKFGVSRQVFSLALKALEEAGLIEVERRQHKSSIITLVS